MLTIIITTIAAGGQRNTVRVKTTINHHNKDHPCERPKRRFVVIRWTALPQVHISFCFLSREKNIIPIARSDRTLTGQRNRSQFHIEFDFELLDASSLRQARDGIVGKLCVCSTFDSLFHVVSLDNLLLTIKRPFDRNLCNNSKVTCVLLFSPREH